jgi:hypothetical protein
MLWKGKKRLKMPKRLSENLKFMDSDNPFGIFNLFLPLRASELNPSFCGVHGA